MGRSPLLVDLSQLQVQRSTHPLSEKRNAGLCTLSVDRSAAQRVLEFLGHCLLDRIDSRRRSGLRRRFLFGTQDVFDYLVLKGKDIEVPDIPGLVGKACDAVGDLEAVLQDLMSLSINVSPEMPPPDPVGAWGLEVKKHPVVLVPTEP